MKCRWKIPLVIIIISIGLISCNSKEETKYSSEPSNNFDILFTYGSCYTDILDTFNSSFTKWITIEAGTTIQFTITTDQKRIIYRKMVEIGLFDYPDKFSITIPTNEIVGKVSPAMRYSILIRNGNISKSLTWIDEIIQPTMEKANNLRGLFQEIINIIQENPAYIKLPDRNFGCA